MSTKFFTNTDGNTLFDKFREIATDMVNFHTFNAVVGYFRSSGYFKLRKEFTNIQKIRILIGINIDNIFRKHNKALLMLESTEKAKEMYNESFINDIKEAKYDQEIEEGILQLCEDLASGKLEMRIYAERNVHAKFYLCLPEKHTKSSDGWVIMGSSNISDSGLGLTQPPRYELNVAMKDYDDVAFCKEEFEKLWEKGEPITADDIAGNTGKTYLGVQPTPYELYIKVLIDTFGAQVEDNFSLDMPSGVRNLKYQQDAVIQGYQMLLEHNGFFLADVVGLGKTMVATMIAKRYIEANGMHTNILVVYPPALEKSWKETFELFGIKKRANFISNGSLHKILENKDNYKEKEEYDLVIVDEAHGFRSDGSERYDQLQRICKAPCKYQGNKGNGRKKVMLLSATPLNNRPADLKNLMLLFQDSGRCSIEGVPNLNDFFNPKILEYNKIMSNRNNGVNIKQVEKIYDEIRSKVLDKITVRRTRHNILNDEYYRKDLHAQGIVFPEILPPDEIIYQLDKNLRKIFYRTLDVLTDVKNANNPDGDGLYYARYRAVENLKPEYHKRFKTNVVTLGENLAGIYRVHMVKRLESSFYAFKKSLDNLLRFTRDMIKMFDEGTVIIAPELNIKDMQAKGLELDEILEIAASKGYDKEDITYPADAFVDSFVDELKDDVKKLEKLKSDWDKIGDCDPKIDEFVKYLNAEMLDAKKNPTGKLVIFSESVDTGKYLFETLSAKLNRKDILYVYSQNRNQYFETIRRSFDANYPEQSDQYNIIITSDVLAEGVNLHRANVIVNYDTPWNATRLMQRIGRVNRIGSVAGQIVNYMFYPSREGDDEINLYNNALIKLQGFHSALGEDAQIYSREEIVKEFKLYNPEIKDKTDRQLELLREVRNLYNSNRQLYEKIKNLPLKSRALRKAKNNAPAGTSIVFVSSPIKTEYYKISDEGVKQTDFLDAAAVFKASIDEKPEPWQGAENFHYNHINAALAKYKDDLQRQTDTSSFTQKFKSAANDKTAAKAKKFLRICNDIFGDKEIKRKILLLSNYVDAGKYAQLTKKINTFASQYQNDKQKMVAALYEIETKIEEVWKRYKDNDSDAEDDSFDDAEPMVVVSESFV